MPREAIKQYIVGAPLERVSLAIYLVLLHETNRGNQYK